MLKKRSRIPWSQYISGFLIFTLLISQTIHVDFFDDVKATSEDYRDIVSILVDRETYSVNRGEILQYAKDIEGYLGSTRTSVLVVDENTPVSVIAAKNEMLYTEGDGDDGVSHLVGTVLIGNIPIPMVYHGGQYFPSLYPYVDFVDKQFVYSKRLGRYESLSDANRLAVEPEIWHGVINPAVGRDWEGDTDIKKIKNFLNKTHEFYTKSGKFSNNIPPRVFYYDGFYESKSVNLKKLFQYGLSMRNSENLIYKRFTKYLLKDLNASIVEFDAVHNKEYNSILEGLGIPPSSDIFDTDTIEKMPDIQTEIPIRSILNNFKGIFNEKSLGDSLLFIHNAGRYNSGSSVRADIGPITMSLMDEMARSTLKEGNSTLQNIIDSTLTTQRLAKRIPIFDHVETSTGVPLSDATGSLDIYDNYYFGSKSTTISSPQQCSIAHGSNKVIRDFGREVLVEANVGYDILALPDHADRLKNDTQELVGIYKKESYSCFDSSGQAKLQSYWGGNSLMRAAKTSSPDEILREIPSGTNFRGFSLPIFSLGGMKETSRMHPASVLDCISSTYQYSLRSPYIRDDGSCKVIFPTEWSTNPILKSCGSSRASHPPRYTCLTQHDILPQNPLFSQSVSDYNTDSSSRSCYAGILTVDGSVAETIGRRCITTDIDGTVIDTTTYENQIFHTIPSLLRHISPTDEEITGAKSNQITPSIPIDIDQYVEFLTPKGNIARLRYPNFFIAQGTDIPSVRGWLKNISEQDWNAIITKENATSLSSNETQANRYLAAGSISQTPIDWNAYISDEFIEKILQAKNWLNPDAVEKYKMAVETTLSYSHQYPGFLYNSPPKLPSISESYEIAYLGLQGLTPSGSEDSQSEYNQVSNDYATKLADIKALNISDPYDPSNNNPHKASDKCGPPDGVNLFQWPQAILCWITTQFPPKILAGSCGANIFGSKSGSSFIPRSDYITPAPALSLSGVYMKTFYAGGRVGYALQKTNMGTFDSLEVQIEYTKLGLPVSLPVGTEVSLIIPPTSSSPLVEISPKTTQVTDSMARFLIQSASIVGDTALQAVMHIPIPGGSVYTATGDMLPIHVSSEYIDPNTLDGNTQFPVTSSSGILFDFSIKDGTGNVSAIEFPLSLDVYDDVSETLIGSGIRIDASTFQFPDTFRKKIGVYTLRFTDKYKRAGDLTLAITPGPLETVSFSPISTLLVKGSKTLGMIELKDILGNLISPELHTVDVSVRGGYMLDAANQRKTSMHIDAMEPQIPLYFTSDEAGFLELTVVVDGNKTIKSTIRIINQAKISLRFDKNPFVGGDPVAVTMNITDTDGSILTGFNSVATIVLPNDAGYFNHGAIPVHSGTASLEYIPGTYAGKHKITADIPGINTVSDLEFTLDAGVPMYVNHKKEGGNIIFTVRDRYKNPVLKNFTGTLQRNNDTPSPISFVQGTFQAPARSGYYVIKIPELQNSSISYTDSEGIHTIGGIPHYATYIDGSTEKFDFLSDYNARYTILAGGSFLREGEDILYNTLPGSGQSLAVSTLLDSQYANPSIFSIYPGGGFSLNTSYIDAPETQLTIENGFPVLGIMNTTDHSRIARVIYRMNKAFLDTCTFSGSILSGESDCVWSTKNNSIRFALDSEALGYTSTSDGNSLRVKYLDDTVLSVSRDGVISLPTGAKVTVDKEYSERSLVIDIQFADLHVGKIIVTTDIEASVEKSTNPFDPITKSTPVIDDTSSVTSIVFSPSVLAGSVVGYQFIQETNASDIDMEKNGPDSIDSIGLTPEVPGIGWRGNNTMILSYAAGDTVGSATQWFHTYTFVNLGDPVTHVDENIAEVSPEGIDRTIGKRLTSAVTKSVVSASYRDMDADGFDDIVALHQDGYLDLLLNHAGKFRFRERIGYVPELLSRGIRLGDFTHDNYADIIGVNNSGSFLYINNTSRRFSQMSMIISDVSGGAPTGVTQFKVYDMDADKRDDIVYLTEGGELGILYGTTSPGVFEKKVIDARLAVSLDPSGSSIGGALKIDGIPQFAPGTLGVSPTNNTGLTDAQLQGSVYYQFTPYAPQDSPTSLDLSNPEDFSQIQDTIGNLQDAQSSIIPESSETYVKSQFAGAYGIEIQRTFENLSSSSLHAGDQVKVSISIHNLGSTVARNVRYLDTIPTIFSTQKTMKYQVILGDQSMTRDFQYMPGGDFDAQFVGRDIPPGETLHIVYQVTALPSSYGEMLVGDFESGETGSDTYGDIGFKTSTTCGADMLLWRSGPTPREYTKGSRSFSQPELPQSIADQVVDSNRNGIPDSMEVTDSDSDGEVDTSNLSQASKQKMLNTLVQQEVSGGTKPLASAKLNTDTNRFSLDFDANAVDDLIELGDNFMRGLQCGFGGGGCVSMPLNWAPLAPGNDPTVFGIPFGDGLKVKEGLPLFSALTGLQTKCGKSPCCLPTVYPVSSRAYIPGPFCGPSSAGGYLGVWAPTNFFRIFVTPTLTLGIGTAICFGGPAFLVGKVPGLGMSPLIQGGNCVIITSKMNFCKGDGSRSDGDLRSLGLGSTMGSWNAQSCSMEADAGSVPSSEEKVWINDVIEYLHHPHPSKLGSIYERLQSFPRYARRQGGPILRLGGAGSRGTSIEVSLDASKPFALGNIIKIKNRRIAGFPDFIMDWVQRQGDEIVKALFTVPHLTIYAPTTLGQFGQFGSSYENMVSRFGKNSLKQGAQNFQSQMGGLTSINSVGGGLNAMRAAYKFIGSLPFVTVSQRNIPINVPWILPSELDKYERTLEAYKREVSHFTDGLCFKKTAMECLNAKASLNSAGFISSINQNLKRIKEYKNFPTKLQKYITWKQRYMTQILCNINSLSQLTGGWLRDNGIRFRKWVELYVLAKAIAESWQPMLDIFYDTSAQCGVCRNQRNDLTYWKFKLISAVIPSIPIIKFPRWPNIILDLSDIQLGINIAVPEFQFKLTPIKLPNLPNLNLPNLDGLNFGLGFSLPNFPLLPPIPTLPELPNLPSFPKIALPNLPPPPKLPKMMSSITGVLKLFKLISKMYCWYNSTYLISEDQAGSLIADRTERRGTLSLDFLSILSPNISLPSVRDIRVSTHVNFNLRSDFIAEYARAAVKPINSFTTDVSRGLPNTIGRNINIQTQKFQIRPQSHLDDARNALTLFQDAFRTFTQENDLLISVDTFRDTLLAELKNSELPRKLLLDLIDDLAGARQEQEISTEALMAFNSSRFHALTQYIQAEYDETAELENIVRTLGKDYSNEPRRLMVSTDSAKQASDTYLLKYEKTAMFNDMQEGPILGDSYPESSIGNLKNKFSRVAAIIGDASSDSKATIASSYKPSFDGIYILTPQGHQTHLFDYLDEVNGSEQVQTIDIDKDGDLDYLYLMNGTIYVKYTNTYVPKKIIETIVHVADIDTNDITVPNFFHESIHTPGKISLSFSPASETENSWRLEFFDKYLAWDAIKISDSGKEDAPKRVMDLYVSPEPTQSETVVHPSFVTKPVTRYLSRVSGKDTFIMSGPEVKVLTGVTQFTVSPGKTIYTGNKRTKILYHTGANSDSFLILEPHQEYTFQDPIEAILQSGKLYIVASVYSQESVTYTDDLVGMPILDTMRLYTRVGGFEIIDAFHKTSTFISGGSDYTLLNLGFHDKEYSISVDYPNGYYSARLKTLDGETSARTTPILLALQASSDKSPPLVDIPESIRIPIYSSKTVYLRDYITEMSRYSVMIDSDVTIDSNGDGDTNNDYSTTGGTGISLQDGVITLGTFSVPGIRTAQIQVTDEFHNISYATLNIEAYTPIPSIVQATATGVVTGQIDEKIPFEPVHIFRVRSGSPIQKLHDFPLRTNEDGEFSTGGIYVHSGVLITLDHQKVTLSPHGTINLPLPSGLGVSVSMANQSLPMTIRILSASGVVYSQFLSLPLLSPIKEGTEQNRSETGGIYIELQGGTRLIPALMADPTIPGGAYLVDAGHRPIVGLSSDGNIYGLTDGVNITYGTKDGYMILSIKKEGVEIGTVWFKVDLFYVLE